jgi:hypothetical protein
LETKRNRGSSGDNDMTCEDELLMTRTMLDAVVKKGEVWREAALEAARYFQGGPDAPSDNERFWNLLVALGVDLQHICSPMEVTMPELNMWEKHTLPARSRDILTRELEKAEGKQA